VGAFGAASSAASGTLRDGSTGVVACDTPER